MDDWIGGKTFRKIFTYITAADADVVDADDDLVRIAEVGDRFIFKTGVFGAVEDYGGVLHFCNGSRGCHC